MTVAIPLLASFFHYPLPQACNRLLVHTTVLQSGSTERAVCG